MKKFNLRIKEARKSSGKQKLKAMGIYSYSDIIKSKEEMFDGIKKYGIKNTKGQTIIFRLDLKKLKEEQLGTHSKNKEVEDDINR